MNLAALWMINCRWARMGVREPIIWCLQYYRREELLQSCSSLCGDMPLRNDKLCVELLEVICKITFSHEYIIGMWAAMAGSRTHTQSLDVFCLLDNLSVWHVGLIISTYNFNMIQYLFNINSQYKYKIQ